MAFKNTRKVPFSTICIINIGKCLEHEVAGYLMVEGLNSTAWMIFRHFWWEAEHRLFFLVLESSWFLVFFEQSQSTGNRIRITWNRRAASSSSSIYVRVTLLISLQSSIHVIWDHLGGKAENARHRLISFRFLFFVFCFFFF